MSGPAIAHDERESLVFTIPGQPEGKRRPRTRVVMQRGRPMATIYSDPADKAREKVIREIVVAAMAGRPPIVTPVRLTIFAIFAPAASWTKRQRAAALDGLFHTSKPDADNISKSVMDGMVAGRGDEPFCLIDDAQVAEQLIRKSYGEVAQTIVRLDLIPAGSNAGRDTLI